MEQLTAQRPLRIWMRGVACGAAALFAMSCLSDGADAASRRSAVADGTKPAATRAKAKAPKGPQCPTAGTRAIAFAKAVDGARFLTTDGMEIQLAGVLAPGADGEALDAAKTDAARLSLAEILQAGALTILADDTAKDRYGRFQAQVFANEVWVQAALLKNGELRASPDRVSAPCAKLLTAAEDEARAKGAGHWRDGLFGLRTPEQIARRPGTFQIVEGTVQTATVTKGRAYINFGADYNTDFTVTVSPQDMKLFRQARMDVKTLAGKRVRVRGWVELYHGPEMEIATPAAIETLP